MNNSHGGLEPKLLVTTDNQSFGRAVAEAVEGAETTASAEQVGPVTDALTQCHTDDFEGAIIDGRIADLAAVVEHLTEQAELPVVVLSDSAGDDDTIARAIEAGATDVFPRTTASTPYELVVDRIKNATRPTATADGSDHARLESERRLRAILERIDEAIYVTRAEELTTPSLHPDDFYAGYEDIWGQPLEEIFETYEEGFFGTLHPEERPGFRSFVADIGRDLDSGSVSDRYSHEYRIERADGERRWIRSDFYPTEWETGPLRMVTVSRDVTERKRREREYEQIFNSVQDAIVVLDPDTVEILDANEAYLDMFGYEDSDEVRKRGVSGLSVTEEGYTEQRGREINQRVAESGQPETLEWQSETRSGERIWLGVKIAPAVIGGEQRTIAIHRDITERKRREQRLEVFNRILRHNLRNQLDVIRSHAEELVDRTEDEHPDRIIDSVDELATIGSRARKIDRLMSTEETLTEVDIAQTLREAVETMEPGQSDVAVTTEFPSETRLWANEQAVTMAVESALENALEHATSAVTVAIRNRPEGCVITIEDDGPGIPEEELTPIESGGETNLQHGRGLGLWQLRWCVDTLNGELSFETGAGTTVRITVPGRGESNHSD